MTFAECLQKFDLDEAIKCMHQGKTQKEIGELFNISNSRVSECFKYYNTKWIRHKYSINETYFDIIDSEEKAYLLGFLVADGCCKLEKRKVGYSKRIAFNNTIDDKEAIEAMHNNICSTVPLVTRSYSKYRRKKPFYNLQWTSEYMFNKLQDKYNIRIHKTFDKDFVIPDNAIPDNLWRHFIRGFFDGDGHVGSNTLEFVFTSELFMSQIMSWYHNFHYRTYHIQGKTTDYWKVIISATDKCRKALFDFFYKDSSLFLKRKYEAFNTEISYGITNRVIEIVEHRIE